MPLELLLPMELAVALLVPVEMTLSWPTRTTKIRNIAIRNSPLNPNPRRLGNLAHLARIAPAAVTMTMMMTPTTP